MLTVFNYSIKLALIGLGFVCICHTINGICVGSIMTLSKHRSALVSLSVEPVRYWLALAFWTLSSIMLIFGGIKFKKFN